MSPPSTKSNPVIMAATTTPSPVPCLDTSTPIPVAAPEPGSVHSAVPAGVQQNAERQQPKKPRGIMLKFKKGSIAALKEGKVVDKEEHWKSVDGGVGGTLADNAGPEMPTSADAGTDPLKAVEVLLLERVVPVVGQVGSNAEGKEPTKIQNVSIERDEMLDGLKSLAIMDDMPESKAMSKAGSKTEGKRPATVESTTLKSKDAPVAKRPRVETEKYKKSTAVEGEGSVLTQARIKAKSRATAKEKEKAKAAVLSAPAATASVGMGATTITDITTAISTTTTKNTDATPAASPLPRTKTALQLLRTLNRILGPHPSLHAPLKAYTTLMSNDLKSAHKTITSLRKEIATLTQNAVEHEVRVQENERAARDMVGFWTDCWVEELGRGVEWEEKLRGVERDRYCWSSERIREVRGETGVPRSFSMSLGHGGARGRNDVDVAEDEHEEEAEEQMSNGKGHDADDEMTTV